MKASLLQEQTLRLTMTQELRQAITILQYSSQELTEFLYEQSLENPLIELKNFEKGNRQKGKSTAQNMMEIYSVNSVSIQQHILNQLQEQSMQKDMKRVCTFLAHNIDENGYLRETNEELATLLEVTVETIQDCVDIVQSLEPAGIGARTLQECLALQLRRLRKRNILAEEIVEHYFAAFAKKDWKQLTQRLQCDTTELQEVVNTITSLQPKPGLEFSVEKPIYIVPDMIVSKENNQFVVHLQQKHIPRVTIHSEYNTLLANETNSEVAAYLSQKYQDMQWILRSLDQRQKTLLRVMQVIVEKQEGFFRKGPLLLKPLSLKEVAEELQLHESTVSRATRNKYVQTLYGLYEMKYFFSNAVSAGEDDAISSKRVKELIRGLVGQENKKKPLSDQKIVELLEREHAISVSRRTIAKYRDQLKIPASSLRKIIG